MVLLKCNHLRDAARFCPATSCARLFGKTVSKELCDTPSFEKGGLGRIDITMLFYNKNNKQHSQQLRKNLTKAEALLWSRLRRKQLCGLQFYRQKPILNYIIDFF